MNVRVPLTHISTPQYITIRLSVPNTNVATTVPFYQTSTMRSIGVAKGITSFSKEQTREVKRIYGFNGDEMEPMYVVPGQITSKVTLSSIVFHESDFLESLGYLRGHMLYQDNPFVIIEDQYKLISTNPNVNLLAGQVTISNEPSVTLARSIYYFDCWLSTNPIEYDIMGDDMILIPELAVEVGRITSSEQTGRVVGEQIFNSITNLVLKK